MEEKVTAEDTRVFRTVRRQRGDEVTDKAVTTLERATEYFDKGARVVLCEKLKARKKGSTAPDVKVSRRCVSLADAETFFEGSSIASRTRKNKERLEWERRAKGTSLSSVDTIPKSTK
jgi:hypothetical protein